MPGNFLERSGLNKQLHPFNYLTGARLSKKVEFKITEHNVRQGLKTQPSQRTSLLSSIITWECVE